MCGLDSLGSGDLSAADCCEHSNEPSGSIEGDFLSRLTLLHGVQIF
jgi:hypothetical protein